MNVVYVERGEHGRNNGSLGFVADATIARGWAFLLLGAYFSPWEAVLGLDDALERTGPHTSAHCTYCTQNPRRTHTNLCHIRLTPAGVHVPSLLLPKQTTSPPVNNRYTQKLIRH